MTPATFLTDFVGLPANFPYQDSASLKAAKWMRGRQFLYKSKYGGTLLITCSSVVTVPEVKVEKNGTETRFTRVYVVSDMGNRYEWDECQLL